MFKQIRETLKAVTSQQVLTVVVLILILSTAFYELIFEYYQLWLIATDTQVSLMGIAAALIFLTVSISGLLAKHLKLNPKVVVIISTILLFLSILSTTLRNPGLLVAALSVLIIILMSLGVVYLEQLHDNLPSHLRSGSSSVVGVFGRVTFIVAALLFGWLVDASSVFNAAWLLVAFSAGLSLLLLKPLFR
jgi:predicted MFS family arabinose efflux permease